MKTPRQQLLDRYERLKSDQSSWLAHWRELNDYILPRRFRYLNTDVNKGTKRNDKIINSTPIRAARVLASGMMAGITSPVRPWFRLLLADGTPPTRTSTRVKAYLYELEQALRIAFHRSNFYNALPVVYGDLGVFGTSSMIIEPDDEDGIRTYVLPLGQYVLQNGPRQNVTTLMREIQLTFGQMGEMFPRAALSESVQNALREGRVDELWPVMHAIMPNLDFMPGYLGPRGKRYLSVWFEKNGPANTGFLRVSGFEEWPAPTARWNVTGEDVYGYSPGMDALGDCKSLQLYERRSAQITDKIATPPMVGPAALRNQQASISPGAWIPVDEVGGKQVRPAIDLSPQAVPLLDQKGMRIERRINEAFFADLWLMLAESDRREITAREVDERHEEKMLQLGPVLDRLHDELLDPSITRSHALLGRANKLPTPPPELVGAPLKIEYISIMAQAQKLLFTTGIERLLGLVGNIKAADEEVVDNVDFDEATREYADLLGVAPKIVRDADAVAIRRSQRQQAQQAAAAAQAAPAVRDGAQAAQVLSQTDVNQPSMLKGLLDSVGGGYSAGVGE